MVDISVVVPVYNPSLDLFGNCLASIERQCLSLDSFEVVLIYDGEPVSAVRKIARRSRSRLNLREIVIPRSGVSAARNAGIDAAFGEWITFLDADDMLADGALKALLRFGAVHDCDVVFGDLTKVYRDGHTEACSYGTEDIKPSPNFAEQIRHDVLRPVTTAGSSCAKLYHLRGDGWCVPRFDECLAVGEDTEFVFRCFASTARIGYLHQCVYLYQRNTDSAVGSFREDYESRIRNSMAVMRSTIGKVVESESYAVDYQSYVLFHLLLVMVHYLFNPSAPWNAAERRKRYRAVLDESLYRTVLGSWDRDAFSLTRNVALFSLKHRLYALSWTIGAVRQYQLRHKEDN